MAVIAQILCDFPHQHVASNNNKKNHFLRHSAILQTPKSLNAFISTTICSLSSSSSLSHPAATEHFTSHVHPEALNKPLNIQIRKRERERDATADLVTGIMPDET